MCQCATHQLKAVFKKDMVLWFLWMDGWIKTNNTAYPAFSWGMGHIYKYYFETFDTF